MKTIKLAPGNIWSGAKHGLAVFTNPTEIAFWKGNLRNHYPVVFSGVEYRDAEAAYQAHTRDKKANADTCYKVCVLVLCAKFEQYPFLLDTIVASGGEGWIRSCSHRVYGRNKRWEGVGLDSGFIRCLLSAYKKMTE